MRNSSAEHPEAAVTTESRWLRLGALSKNAIDLNLLVLAGGELFTRLLTFIAFAYLSRVLGVEAFGQLETALAVLMFGFLTVELGYKTIGAKIVAQHPDQAQSLVGRILPSQWTIASGLLLITMTVAWLAPLDRGLASLLVGLMATLLIVPAFLPWVFQGQQRMAWIAVPQVVRQLVFLVCVLLLVREPSDLSRLPLAEWLGVVAAAAICLAAYWSSGLRLVLQWHPPLDKGLFLSGLPIGISLLTWATRNFFPIILLGFMVAKDEIGYFGGGMRLLMALQVGVMVYWTNYYPKLSQLAQGAFSDMRHHLRFSTWLLTSGLFVVAIVCFLTAETLLRIVFGPSFTNPIAVDTFRVLICILPIAAWRSHASYALFVMNRQTIELGASLLGIALLLAFALQLTPQYGSVGMAWAMVLSELLGGVLVWTAWWWTAGRLHGLDVRSSE